MLTYAKRDYVRTIADCTKAFELDPKCDCAYYFRARALMDRTPDDEQNIERMQRDYSQALENLNRFIELKPGSAGGYFFRGLTYFRLTVFEKAIPDCNKALTMNPTQDLLQAARIMKGYACELSNHFSEALEPYEKYLELVPGNKDIQEKVKRMESLWPRPFY